MNTTTTHHCPCCTSTGAETTADYSDFPKHQSFVGEIRDIGKQMNDTINESGIRCRWWMLLKETPYTKGDVNLAGWNSQADYNRGKMAFNTNTTIFFMHEETDKYFVERTNITTGKDEEMEPAVPLVADDESGSV